MCSGGFVVVWCVLVVQFCGVLWQRVSSEVVVALCGGGAALC